MHNFYSI